VDDLFGAENGEGQLHRKNIFGCVSVAVPGLWAVCGCRCLCMCMPSLILFVCFRREKKIPQTCPRRRQWGRSTALGLLHSRQRKREKERERQRRERSYTLSLLCLCLITPSFLANFLVSLTLPGLLGKEGGGG